MAKLHSIWTEKYRPQTIKDCILPKATRKELTGFIKSGKIPNLMLTGSAGTGKTTAATALCRELDYEVLIINGSNEGRLIDTLRTKITNFASTVSLDGRRKCVILDEADYIGPEVQAALRNFTEEFSGNCSFVFTCNFPNRIIAPLHSRCAVIDFAIPKDERQDLILQLFKRISTILETEEVSYDKKVLVTMVGKFFPDMRRLLNELQRKGVNGEIDAGSLVGSGVDDIAELVGYLKDKNFREMRKWVGSTTNLDISYISRSLYDKMYDICQPDSMPNLILLIADYQYKDAHVADKEINIVAMLTELMMNVEFK